MAVGDMGSGVLIAKTEPPEIGGMVIIDTVI